MQIQSFFLLVATLALLSTHVYGQSLPNFVFIYGGVFINGTDDGTHKVGRGVSYASDPWHTRIAGRNWVSPEFKKPGFRLAKDLEE